MVENEEGNVEVIEVVERYVLFLSSILLIALDTFAADFRSTNWKPSLDSRITYSWSTSAMVSWVECGVVYAQIFRLHKPGEQEAQLRGRELIFIYFELYCPGFRVGQKPAKHKDNSPNHLICSTLVIATQRPISSSLSTLTISLLHQHVSFTTPNHHKPTTLTILTICPIQKFFPCLI